MTETINSSNLFFDATDPTQIFERPLTIILSDGSRIEDLTVEGNYLFSKKEITKKTFERKLDKVTFTDGKMNDVHGQMELLEIEKEGDLWRFLLRDMSEEEVFRNQIKADISFLAMMTDVDM